MVNESAKYTANIGIASISTANSSLTGTGTISPLISGAANGTLVKEIIIKAVVNTSRGMIRFFIFDGTKTRLLEEVDVFPTTTSGVDYSFISIISMDFKLASGDVIYVSTEKAETFHVTAIGLDWAY